MRLFTAIALPGEGAARLDEGIRLLRNAGARGRFVPRENLHLTLHFLGEAEDPRPATDAIEAVEFPSFTMVLSGLGSFPGRKGRVLWMGLEPCRELAELQRTLGGELSARGFRLEGRPYRPHLTLARRGSLPPAVEREAGKLLGRVEVPVADITLFRSELGPGGPVYTQLHRKTLAGGERGTR